MNKHIGLSPQPWTQSVEQALDKLDVAVKSGLDAGAVKARREQFGLNRLREAKRRSSWTILADQFKSLVVLLLVAAAGISFVFGEWIEGVAIVVVIALNAAIGFFTEIRAVRSMEALKKMGHVTTKVRREGQIQEIGAEELVPGDIIIIDGGDIVTADLLLLEASKLQANESALTGESVPVGKTVQALPPDTILAERSNMLFKGTAVTRGAGVGIVVATGMQTELGEISSLVEEAEDESTPLEQRLDQLGRRLIWVTLIIAATVAITGIWRGKEILLMIETSIALAVAAIPEGLPIVATIALARGMQRMARRNALVNRLAAVETLGGTNVICTDKTGTLTENQMTVTRLVTGAGEFSITGEGLERKGEFRQNGSPIDPAQHQLLRQALEIGVLCNNASLPDESRAGKDHPGSGAVGDPVEVALLVAGQKAGLDRSTLVEKTPEKREEAFDPDSKMMATFHQVNDEFQVAVKGAPESVLEVCTLVRTAETQRDMTAEQRQCWNDRNQELAEEGFRVLALATKTVETTETAPYENLVFVGLVGFVDPPRDDVKEAILACKRAGIQVVMVTGDQPITARNIGQAVGLVDSAATLVITGQELQNLNSVSAEQKKKIVEALIFARVSPKQKLALIDIHQGNNSVVAMTGDGVNDAPALKKADIWIAMGQRGTQVAREAADMVLRDDAFSTIVVAVEQGRIIFDNIRKFVLYLLSCNISEIITVGLASLVNAPLPVLPLQILFLNLVTDVFPALALGVGEGDPGVMNRRPRDPREPIMSRSQWYQMASYGLVITASVFSALALALLWLDLNRNQAITVSFLTLAFAQLWHVFNMREPGSNLLRNEVTRNRFVWGALLLCTFLLLIAVYLPGLSDVLKVVDPEPSGWAVVLVMSAVPLVIGQLWKLLMSRG